MVNRPSSWRLALYNVIALTEWSRNSPCCTSSVHPAGA
jgi:hypothetical protein